MHGKPFAFGDTGPYSEWKLECEMGKCVGLTELHLYLSPFLILYNVGKSTIFQEL